MCHIDEGKFTAAECPTSTARFRETETTTGTISFGETRKEKNHPQHLLHVTWAHVHPLLEHTHTEEIRKALLQPPWDGH